MPLDSLQCLSMLINPSQCSMSINGDWHWSTLRSNEINWLALIIIGNTTILIGIDQHLTLIEGVLKKEAGTKWATTFGIVEIVRCPQKVTQSASWSKHPSIWSPEVVTLKWPQLLFCELDKDKNVPTFVEQLTAFLLFELKSLCIHIVELIAVLHRLSHHTLRHLKRSLHNNDCYEWIKRNKMASDSLRIIENCTESYTLLWIELSTHF